LRGGGELFWIKPRRAKKTHPRKWNQTRVVQKELRVSGKKKKKRHWKSIRDERKDMVEKRFWEKGKTQKKGGGTGVRKTGVNTGRDELGQN